MLNSFYKFSSLTSEDIIAWQGLPNSGHTLLSLQAQSTVDVGVGAPVVSLVTFPAHHVLHLAARYVVGPVGYGLVVQLVWLYIEVTRNNFFIMIYDIKL